MVWPADKAPEGIRNANGANRLEASVLATGFRTLFWVEILVLFAIGNSSNLRMACT